MGFQMKWSLYDWRLVLKEKIGDKDVRAQFYV